MWEQFFSSWRNDMKKYSLLFLILIIGITSCSDSVWPVNDNNQMDERVISTEPNWISLPSPSNISMQKKYSVTKKIKHNKSEELEFKYNSHGRRNRDGYKVKVKLEFPKGCIDKDVEITLEFDRETGVITLLPCMEFNEPVELDYFLEGLDLQKGDEDLIDFVYLCPDGIYESIERLELKVEHPKGKLHLRKGLLHHFSRFGYTF